MGYEPVEPGSCSTPQTPELVGVREVTVDDVVVAVIGCGGISCPSAVGSAGAGDKALAVLVRVLLVG